MLIDLNKVEFSLDPSFGDWLNMTLDGEYIECVTLFEGDETDDLDLGPLFYTYKVSAKLLHMRNCDYIYISNAGAEYNSNDFQTIDLTVVNHSLRKLWRH